MKLISGRVSGAASFQDAQNFTGEAWVDPVLADPEDAKAYNVFFQPGARNHWHRHTGGQILLITGGHGRLGSRDGATFEVRAGDVVWIPPGEEHWHGATETTVMSHIAVSLGEAEWLEPVPDSQYQSEPAPSAS